MIEVHPASLAMLVRSVALIALDLPTQIEWLISLGLGEPLYLDELVTDFSAGALLVPQFVDKGWLSDVAHAAILKMDEIIALHDGTGDEDPFWRIATNSDNEDWMRLRKLARDVLFAIG